MIDISKCVGDGCPIKHTCRRFTEKSDLIQSYLVDTPYSKETKECDLHYSEFTDANDSSKRGS